MSKWNVAEIPALVDVAVEHEADIFAFARYCPSMAEPERHLLPPGVSGHDGGLLGEVQKYETRGCKTTFSLKDHLWILFQYEKGLFDPGDYPKDDMIYGGCNCGNCHMTILSRRGGVRLPPDGGAGWAMPLSTISLTCSLGTPMRVPPVRQV